jgi:hypothetical protein
MPVQCSFASGSKADGFRPAWCRASASQGRCKASTLPRSGRLTPSCRSASASLFGPNCRSGSPRLGNRVGPDDQAKVYAALHARIPMVTPHEQRAIQEANAEGDEQFWDAMRDIGASSVEEYKALIARAETKIAEHAAGAAEAGERAQAAKDRLERIRRGESVPGDLGKPFDAERALKAAGFTERDLRRMRLLASLTEAEMKQASAKTCAEVVGAADRAAEREARRIIRARREAERLRLSDDERAVLRIMERDLRRTLTEQEEHLSLEQARSLGMV